MLKINGNNISEIKFNGNNILLAKINDNVVFNNSSSIPLYKFGLLSDIHIDGDGTDTYNTISKFQNAINYYKNNVDFVCITGDISYDGRESDFTNYQTIVGDVDVKTISGNHDASSFDLYTQYTGDSLYYEYTIQNDVFLFVGADSTFSYTKPLTDEEFTWLKTKLEEYKNKRVFVMFHFFINPVGNANNLAKTEIFDTTSTQGQEFVSLLSTYKNIILCTGHSHLEFGMEKYEETANYMPKGNTCARIHTPSLGYPKTNDTGTSNADTYNLTDVGFGYLVEVYSDKTKFRAIKFGLSSYSMLNDYVYEIPVT